MKRRRRANRWDIGIARPRRPERKAAYPLPRSLGARSVAETRPELAPRRNGAGKLPGAVAPARPRGVRAIAWLIIAALPLSVGAWFVSVAVPVAIEARQAA